MTLPPPPFTLATSPLPCLMLSTRGALAARAMACASRCGSPTANSPRAVSSALFRSAAAPLIQVCVTCDAPCCLSVYSILQPTFFNSGLWGRVHDGFPPSPLHTLRLARMVIRTSPPKRGIMVVTCHRIMPPSLLFRLPSQQSRYRRCCPRCCRCGLPPQQRAC